MMHRNSIIVKTLRSIYGIFTMCKHSVSGVSRDPGVKKSVPAVMDHLSVPPYIFAVVSAQTAASLFRAPVLFVIPIVTFSSSHHRPGFSKLGPLTWLRQGYQELRNEPEHSPETSLESITVTQYVT